MQKYVTHVTKTKNSTKTKTKHFYHNSRKINTASTSHYKSDCLLPVPTFDPKSHRRILLDPLDDTCNLHVMSIIVLCTALASLLPSCNDNRNLSWHQYLTSVPVNKLEFSPQNSSLKNNLCVHAAQSTQLLDNESCHYGVPTAPIRVSDTLTTVSSAQDNCLQGHITFSQQDRSCRDLVSLITTYDTCSMVNCITKASVHSSWTIKPSDTWVKGVGGKLVKSSGTVVIPNHSFAYSGKQHSLEADIIESLPRGIHLLVGLPTIVDPSIAVVPDLANYRCYLTALKETLRLDNIDKVVSRHNSDPKRIVSACAGLLPEIGVLMSLGWSINNIVTVQYYCSLNNIV